MRGPERLRQWLESHTGGLRGRVALDAELVCGREWGLEFV